MKKNRGHKYLIFVVGIILFLNSSISASLKFERFSNKEGFNQNTIKTIEQDKYGFIWIGTPNGLIKYDGYEFRHFTSNAKINGSISDNALSCLLNDSKGILWIGTRVGVDIYIPWLDKYLKVPLEEAVNVTDIDVDVNGRMWISGQKQLFVCDINISKNDVSFTISENLIKAEFNIHDINTFYFIDTNSALLATQSGLVHLNISEDEKSQFHNIESIYRFDAFENTVITTLNRINDVYWIGTNNGLYKATFEGERIHIIHEFKSIQTQEQPILDLAILSVFEDNLANVWVGTKANGLLRYIPEDDDFEHYAYNPKNTLGLSSPQINCIYQDNYGVIWIGTAQGGINKLDLTQKQFFNYAHNPYDNSSISGNLVNSILEDSKGKVWISTDVSVCRSINVLNETSASTLRFENLESQLPFGRNEPVRSIFEDEKGFVWMGTETSFVVYNPVNNSIRKIVLGKNENNSPISRCFVISQIDEDRIIFGGNKIIVVKNPWEQIQNENNIVLEIESITDVKGGWVQALHKDGRGNLWIGASNGLFKCNCIEDKLFVDSHFSTQNNLNISLSNNDVFSLHEDDEGNLWIGTFGGGLDKMVLNEKGEPEKIEYFRKDEVLPDDAVYGIIQEDDKYMWLSTDMGLCRLNTANKVAEVFDVRDGLPNNNFRQNAFHKGKSGYYYFGGLNGLTVFKPEDITLNKVSPTVLITSLSVNNKAVKVSEKVNGKVLLTKSILETESIGIGHKERIIAFNLSAIQTSTPAKNRLQYMLEGFNDEWIETETGKTTVTYTNLPAGEYVFRIKGANSDGLWSTESTDLKLIVWPPWYQTWWSYLLLFLILVSAAIGVSVYFIRLEKLKQSLKYAQVDKERMDKINQGKLRFFTNISHEFRTPLTLIAGPLERIMALDLGPENSRYVSIIHNNTKRLLNLVDQLITFRQAEQGYLSLKRSSNTLGEFIYPATEAFEDYALQKNINFFYKVNSPNEEVVIDIEKTERIIFNLLSNSFRNTPANGTISIETEVISEATPKMLSIKFIDSGKGIPKYKQEKIFERFYQLEGRKENVGGTGIGLAFCKSLVDLMGGTISVESEPNLRTCFTVMIPCDGSGNYNTNENEYSGKSYIRNWIELPVAAQNEPSGFGGETIEANNTVLIVEDEADVRDFLKNAFCKKYKVVLAVNGKDGLEKLEQHEPNLIISDVMMPEMDGFEFCTKVRSAPETSHIPFILLTALGDDENNIKGLEFGADDYISKPFSLRHLELKVDKLVENSKRLKEHFSKNSIIPDKGIKMSTRDKDFLTKLINAMEANLSNSDFGIEELALAIGQSHSQFYRRLKQLTGQTPIGYFRNYRLQRAAQLLKGDFDLNVTQVMDNIGIESHSYFSTSFKKLHGVSPSEYLRKNMHV